MKTLFHITFITLVLLVAVTSAQRTISSYEELEEFGFNEPPRHGLKLLDWFIRECMDNNMVATCNPTQGDYGFHVYYNYPYWNNQNRNNQNQNNQNQNNRHLFPVISDRRQYTYYTIGNLNSPGANNLPEDVRENSQKYFGCRNPFRNMDRLVVRYNNNNRHIEEIYISAHYSRCFTFRIDPELIQSVQSGIYNQDL